MNVVDYKWSHNYVRINCTVRWSRSRVWCWLYCVERHHVTSNEKSCTWWQNKDCMLSHLLNRPYPHAVLFDLLLFSSSCYSMMGRLHTMIMHLLGLHRDIFSSVSISIWHFLFKHFLLNWSFCVLFHHALETKALSLPGAIQSSLCFWDDLLIRSNKNFYQGILHL